MMNTDALLKLVSFCEDELEIECRYNWVDGMEGEVMSHVKIGDDSVWNEDIDNEISIFYGQVHLESQAEMEYRHA